jgi:uncharacterized membrane protein YcaP (DUF421 family)
METIIQLSANWWEFALRAFLVYLVVLVLIRMSGKRTVGEFTPFDLIVVILVGESMQQALVQDDTSVLGPAITAATLILLNWILGFLSTRFQKVDKVVEGEPVVLVRNGRIDTRKLRRENVPKSDVLEAVRRAQLGSLSEVAVATLETDGEITIVPRKKK